MPRSLMLAATSARVATWLRAHGLHRVVGAAKGLNLKRVVFGGGRDKVAPLSDEDRAWLVRYHDGDLQWLARLRESGRADRVLGEYQA